jgi:DNA ligase-1
VRFPRMLRIRDDKPLHEADTLDTLRALIGA